MPTLALPLEEFVSAAPKFAPINPVADDMPVPLRKIVLPPAPVVMPAMSSVAPEEMTTLLSALKASPLPVPVALAEIVILVGELMAVIVALGGMLVPLMG